jgi:AAA15 family ATPase/GTPase
MEDLRAIRKQSLSGRMIEKIRISGFRSIREQEIELSKVNVIYGGTATGKSSVLYSLFVLRNFVKNKLEER